MKRKEYCLSFVLAIVLTFTGVAASAPVRPTTVAEIALYKGADRQQILEEGAKKEGKLIFYTTGVAKQAVSPQVDAFQKRYPYIKVEIWRAGGDDLLPRILEEYRAGKNLCDVIESTQLPQIVLQGEGILQPFYSPNLAYIQEGAITKAPGEGALAIAFRESGIGLGYNTKLITREQAPKNFQDLIDPKWKGKSAISGGDTGQTWFGTMLVNFGEDFVKKVAEQKFAVHMVSARALLDMIINGEYALSPTIYNSHIVDSKKQGAPCDWIPLEPVHVNLGQISMPKRSIHPHAALLFIDFELSKESAEFHKTIGYDPTRQDVIGTKTYKKFYGAKTVEEAMKWKELFNQLFLQK